MLDKPVSLPRVRWAKRSIQVVFQIVRLSINSLYVPMSIES